MEILDRIDRKILIELDCNSRQPLAALARKLRLGRDIVDYRVRKMHEEGVIVGFHAMLNSAMLGMQMYKTYFRLGNIPNRKAELLDRVRKMPSAYWVAESDGSWDFMLASLTRTPLEFQEIQNQFMHEFRDIFLVFQTFTVLRTRVYAKSYLTETGRISHEFGGDVPQINIDKTDALLLQTLTTDARVSIRELSEKLHVSESTVAYRINKLEEEGLIARYRIAINHAALGIRILKGQLYLRDYNQKELKRLLEYCDKEHHLSCFIEQLGQSKLEVEYEAKDYYHFTHLIDEMKKAFPKLISHVDITSIRREERLSHLGTYLPRSA